ncbi:hypothetical protein RB8865 [Rhodopirellula baltica SH 1]|uniref:Uncharacterized protein n=1 Tax=Rhodopirellula baltica (strain DSM 10527 / NCIMB 13988 / SH1) TaxID=243090 RepID=Q7UMF4_RHOBA|nr:hypothetical protein RB8865 [Rhodopirellula baltica SH 1]
MRGPKPTNRPSSLVDWRSPPWRDRSGQRRLERAATRGCNNAGYVNRGASRETNALATSVS